MGRLGTVSGDTPVCAEKLSDTSCSVHVEGFVNQYAMEPISNPQTLGLVVEVIELMAVAFIRAGLAPQSSNPLIGNDRNHY